jgi:hypothetical protein
MEDWKSTGSVRAQEGQREERMEREGEGEKGERGLPGPELVLM